MRRKLLQWILATIAVSLTLSASAQLSGFYQEDFEGTFPPTGWQTENVLDSIYSWIQSGSQHHSGTHSAYMHYSSGPNTQAEDWLILPQFIVGADDSFSFWLAVQYINAPPDSTSILISTTDNNLSSFTNVAGVLSEGNNYPAGINTFNYYSFSLAGFAGQTIYVALKNRNKNGDGIFIDLVSIGNPLQNQDAEAVSIDMLNDVSTVSALIPKATVKNNSLTQQSFSVSMTITGGYSSVKDVINLAPGGLEQIDFDPYTPVAGEVTVSVQTQLSGDEDPGNDTLSKVITAYDPLSGFYQEDFEGTFPPLAWQVKDVLDHPNSWMQDSSIAYSGTRSALLFFSSIDVQGEDWLILPQFTVAATDSFSFWLAVANTGYPPDSTYILVSTTDTYLSGFTNVLGIISEGNNYPDSTLIYQYYSFSLANYAGQNIYVAFKNRNIWGDGIYVDLVSIGTPPLALNATAISIDIPDYISTAVLSPMATVQNNSIDAESFSVTLTATGGYTSTMDVINLAAGAIQQITFDPWTPIIGNATVSLMTQLTGDLYPADDSISRDVSVLDTFTNYGWTIKPDALYTAYDPALASVNHTNGSSSLYELAGRSGVNLLADASIFDPASNSWSSLSPMPVANFTSNAVALNDKIYVIGGYNDFYTGDNQIYDIVSDTWSSGASMPVPVGDYAFGVYHDSLLYFMGGYDPFSGTAYDLVQIYDPVADSWTNGTSVPAPGFGWQAGIAGNKIVLSGGSSLPYFINTPTSYVGTIDASNPANITWVQVNDFPAGGIFRQGSGNSIDPANGLVVFTGGDSAGVTGTSALSSTFAYDVNSNTWKIGPDKPTAANNLRNLACVVYNDSMFMASVGGFDGNNDLKVNEWLNLGPAPLGTGIIDNAPNNFELSSYPNPFSKFTSISFSLDHSSAVRISIVDVMGKEVRELCYKILPAGPQQITWNALGYSAGVYFCKVNVNGNVGTQKLVKLN